jgi:hypothetical protein
MTTKSKTETAGPPVPTRERIELSLMGDKLRTACVSKLGISRDAVEGLSEGALLDLLLGAYDDLTTERAHLEFECHSQQAIFEAIDKVLSRSFCIASNSPTRVLGGVSRLMSSYLARVWQKRPGGRKT